MRLFISYRRDDTAGHAGRLFDTFERRFPHPVFMDVHGMQAAQDFVATTQLEIERSDVLLALIGRSWVGPREGRGPHRIDSPEDLVRREIESALAADIPIVPILVWGASMPAERDLPESLRALTRLHAVELSDSR